MIWWHGAEVIQWLKGMMSKQRSPNESVENQAWDPPFDTRRPFHFLISAEVLAAARAAGSKARLLCWYDNYDGVEIPCPRCRRPVPLRKGGGEWDSLQCEFVTHSCPFCGEPTGCVFFPNKTEAMAAGDSDVVRRYERAETRKAGFQRHCLKDPGQLPDIEGESFTLEWDIIEQPGKESWTVIRLNGEEIFREFAFWENGKRYGEIAAILKAKYGDRLKDVTPTYAGWVWLGGDHLPDLIEAQDSRKNIFGVTSTVGALSERRANQ